MDVRQLEVVVAVADEGTFTAAAQRVHVSQPALSQSVRSLEAELGTPLFTRLPRHAVPTAAGRALVDHARLVLRTVQAARAAVADVIGVQGGQLDLVSLPTLAADPVARLIGEFRRRHPGVVVRLAEPEDTPEVVAMLRDGRAELGVADAWGDPPAGLEVLPLLRQTFMVVCPPGTRSAGGHGQPAGEAARHPFVVTPLGTSTRQVFERVFPGSGARPEVAVETAQREALLPLVLAGAGATLLPSALAAYAATLGAVVFELDPPASRDVALFRRAGPQSPAARAFAELGLAIDTAWGRPAVP